MTLLTMREAERRIRRLQRRERRRALLRRLIPWIPLALALLAWTAVAHAQMVPALSERHSEAISYAELTGYAGVTICYRGRTYSYLATSLTALEQAETRAHEARHRAQMARFSSCGAYDTWYQTARGQLEAEADAYGAGWCAGVAFGADSASRRNSVIDRLRGTMGRRVDSATVVRAVLKYERCDS